MDNDRISTTSKKNNISFFGENSQKGVVNIRGRVGITAVANTDVSFDDGKSNASFLEAGSELILGSLQHSFEKDSIEKKERKPGAQPSTAKQPSFIEGNDNTVHSKHAQVGDNTYNNCVFSNASSPASPMISVEDVRKCQEALRASYSSQKSHMQRQLNSNLDFNAYFTEVEVVETFLWERSDALIVDKKEQAEGEDTELSPQVTGDIVKNGELKRGEPFDPRPVENKKITLEDLFNNQAPKDSIQSNGNQQLLYGSAGMGKSTLCQYLAWKWSQGNEQSEVLPYASLSSYSWVFLIKLKHFGKNELNAKDPIDLLAKIIYQYALNEEGKRLIGYDETTFCSAIVSLIKDTRSNYSNILWLLDGMDEIPLSISPMEESALSVLFRMPHSLITSRPYPNNKWDIAPAKELRLMGFSTIETKKKFITHYFSDAPSRGKLLLHQLNKHSDILAVADVPLFLSFICSYWRGEESAEKEGKIFLSGITGLYSTVTKRYIERYCCEKKGLQSSPSAHRNQRVLYKVCCEKIESFLESIAFKAMKNDFYGKIPQNIIDDEEGRVFGDDNIFDSCYELGLLQPIGLVSQDVCNKLQMYEFAHTTFQEYYAARYIVHALLADNHENEVMTIFLKNHRYHPRWGMVWQFAIGITAHSDEYQKAENSLWSIITTPPYDIALIGHIQLMTRCLGGAGAKLAAHKRLQDEWLNFVYRSILSEGNFMHYQLHWRFIAPLLASFPGLAHTLADFLLQRCDELTMSFCSAIEQSAGIVYRESNSSHIFEAIEVICRALGEKEILNEEVFKENHQWLLKIFNKSHPGGWRRAVNLLGLLGEKAYLPKIISEFFILISSGFCSVREISSLFRNNESGFNASNELIVYLADQLSSKTDNIREAAIGFLQNINIDILSVETKSEIVNKLKESFYDFSAASSFGSFQVLSRLYRYDLNEKDKACIEAVLFKALSYKNHPASSLAHTTLAIYSRRQINKNSISELKKYSMLYPEILASLMREISQNMDKEKTLSLYEIAICTKQVVNIANLKIICGQLTSPDCIQHLDRGQKICLLKWFDTQLNPGMGYSEWLAIDIFSIYRDLINSLINEEDDVKGEALGIKTTVIEKLYGKLNYSNAQKLIISIFELTEPSLRRFYIEPLLGRLIDFSIDILEKEACDDKESCAHKILQHSLPFFPGYKEEKLNKLMTIAESNEISAVKVYKIAGGEELKNYLITLLDDLLRTAHNKMREMDEKAEKTTSKKPSLCPLLLRLKGFKYDILCNLEKVDELINLLKKIIVSGRCAESELNIVLDIVVDVFGNKANDVPSEILEELINTWDSTGDIKLHEKIITVLQCCSFDCSYYNKFAKKLYSTAKNYEMGEQLRKHSIQMLKSIIDKAPQASDEKLIKNTLTYLHGLTNVKQSSLRILAISEWAKLYFSEELTKEARGPLVLKEFLNAIFPSNDTENLDDIRWFMQEVASLLVSQNHEKPMVDILEFFFGKLDKNKKLCDKIIDLIENFLEKLNNFRLTREHINKFFSFFYLGNHRVKHAILRCLLNLKNVFQMPDKLVIELINCLKSSHYGLYNSVLSAMQLWPCETKESGKLLLQPVLEQYINADMDRKNSIHLVLNSIVSQIGLPLLISEVSIIIEKMGVTVGNYESMEISDDEYLVKYNQSAQALEILLNYVIQHKVGLIWDNEDKCFIYYGEVIRTNFEGNPLVDLINDRKILPNNESPDKLSHQPPLLNKRFRQENNEPSAKRKKIDTSQEVDEFNEESQPIYKRCCLI